jgi:ribonucleoside-diphosphate reductase alpha chain
MGGRYVPSLLAAIGGVIERHMIEIGFLSAPGKLANDADKELNVVGLDTNFGGSNRGDVSRDGDGVNKQHTMLRQCPKCAQPSLIKQEGCDTCTSCGYSKCG